MELKIVFYLISKDKVEVIALGVGDVAPKKALRIVAAVYIKQENNSSK